LNVSGRGLIEKISGIYVEKLLKKSSSEDILRQDEVPEEPAPRHMSEARSCRIFA
jgi:hypothetical protein